MFGLDQMVDIAGTGLNIAGDLFQGQANANVADYNAQIADQSAVDVKQQGAEEARRSLVNSTKMLSAGQAAYGASGVSGGSVHDVLRAGAAQGELNVLTIQHNADVKATAYGNEASLDRYRASNDITASQIGAAGALLKGIGGFVGGGSSGGSDAADYEEIA